MVGEFELIRQFFAGDAGDDVLLGIGDDAALVRPRADLAMALDTLVAGVHFPLDAPPESIGHKALAVNLSDLAAMGARPAWFLLGLTLERADSTWLAAFSEGLRGLGRTHGVALVGGDVTRGPLTLSVQVSGEVPAEQALRRDGARPGDGIYVSGTLGDAALGLALWQSGQRRGEYADWLVERLHRPTPRVALGLRLRGLASACIDVSDGLYADLGHVLEASGVGARVELARLPLSKPLRALVPGAELWDTALCGGDDYELCFTVPPDREAALARVSAELSLPLSRIGEVRDEPGLALCLADGRFWQPGRRAYAHFRAEDD
ncbi:thiamine-phosphate kinase [Alkalilimnicola sp. S0819]|uniref:thiamine-phosphate kinase n=1 Tax=Alkalilimnicola sp. S0819 TaxID=2613922 RepID=UPI00126182FD|nr:thiamine-phosphate kinase [Alkalilimnicola sp. S0819]KAB7622758.1 thiamine-phosphate kinase [Alkalilimnicola sp. S0819]MPQ17251.1 thiamine-phosphate kinase [Alkalilimnicola sp. S0819]